jgi:hypothetical protein
MGRSWACVTLLESWDALLASKIMPWLFADAFDGKDIERERGRARSTQVPGLVDLLQSRQQNRHLSSSRRYL